RRAEGKLERVQHARRGDLVPEALPAQFPRADDQRRQRDEHDRAQVKEREGQGKSETGQRAPVSDALAQGGDQSCHGLLSRLVYLIENAAVGEMDLLRLAPAAENVVDVVERDLGELRGMRRQHRLVARAVKVLGLDLLRLFRIEELEIG